MPGRLFPLSALAQPVSRAPWGEKNGAKGNLVGLARVAAESRQLSEKRRREYFSLASQSILNRCSSPNMPFTWTVNPYRGCEFGCKYCYARYTHEFMGMEDPREFEEKIYSKERA